MAKRAFLGVDTPIPQVDTITISGVWAAADTVTVEVDGAGQLICTVDSASLTDVGNAIVYMLTGTGTLPTGYKVTATGAEIGEYQQFSSVELNTATNVVTITGAADGRPFSLTVTETTAGSGTASETTATMPTGPHDFNVAKNWSGGAVPVDGDEIIFDSRMQNDLRYNISQPTITPDRIEYTRDCTKNVGLEETNTTANPNYPFYESLTTHLTMGEVGLSMTVNIGVSGPEVGANRMGWIKLNTNLADVTGTIDQTRTRTNSAAPVSLQGASSSTTWHFNRGDIDIAVQEDQTFSVNTVNVGYIDSQASDVRLQIGSGSSNAILFWNQTGGQVTTQTAIGTSNIDGGTINYRAASGATTIQRLRNAVLNWENAGTISNIIAWENAVIDASRDSKSRTLTDFTMNAGSTFLDPRDSVALTDGIEIPGDLNDVTIRKRVNQKLVFTAL